MIQDVVEEMFETLFALTDLRQILRETKITYQLNADQKKKVKGIINTVRRSMSIIEKELLV